MLSILPLPRSHTLGWMSGMSNQHDRRIFLALFVKLSSVSKRSTRNFRKATNDKKASTTFPHWGNVYRLVDLDAFRKAPKVSESFSRLLDKTALSLDDTAKLKIFVFAALSSLSPFLFGLSRRCSDF